jgi:hypothetical protein
MMVSHFLKRMIRQGVQTGLAGNPRARLASTLASGIAGAAMFGNNMQAAAGDVMEIKGKVAAQPGGSDLNKMLFGKELDE